MRPLCPLGRVRQKALGGFGAGVGFLTFRLRWMARAVRGVSFAGRGRRWRAAGGVREVALSISHTRSVLRGGKCSYRDGRDGQVTRKKTQLNACVLI